MNERTGFAGSFLKTPDLFPARPSGEVWGDRRLLLHFVGGPYLLRGLNSEQEKLLRRRFGKVCGDLKDSAKVGETAGVAIFRAAGSDFVEIDLRGWQYTLDFDYHPQAVRLAGFDWMGRIDWGSAGPEGSLWTAARGDEFLGVLENHLRILAAYQLAEKGGALLHSSCLVDDGGAYVFLGPSGAGKTTLARLGIASGRTVLSDDLNALCLKEDGLHVAPVPFAGELSTTVWHQKSYPLRAICRLEKGQGIKVEMAHPASALATTLACAPFINRDPHRIEALTTLLESIVVNTPRLSLNFNLDDDFWPALLRSVKAHPPGRENL